MRYYEFKPTLLEFAPPTGKGANDLQLLANIIEIVPSEDPLYHVAMSIIKGLVNDVVRPEQEKAVDIPTQQPVQQQVQQPVKPAQQPTQQRVQPPAQQQVQQPAQQPDQAINESPEPGDEAWYEEFLNAAKDPVMKDRMLQKLRSDPEYREEMKYVHKNSEKKVKQAYTKGGTDALITVDQFFKEVKTSADFLAGKAVGVLGELRKWYALEAERNKVQGKTDPNVKENQRPKPTQNALYQKLLYPLENIFQDLGFRDSPPNLRAFKQEYPKILKFMKTCEEGIIEFEDLLSAGNGTHNVGDLITDPELKYVYDKIFDKLLALDAGQGGGAWGPGELGLSILCKPVSKAKNKGDLTTTIDGEEVGVEVKASRVATSGGRLGGKGVMAGTAGRKDFIAALKNLCQQAKFPLDEVGKNYAEVTKVKTVNKVKTKVGTGQMKEVDSVKATNMASEKWFRWFNREIPKRLTKNRIMAKEAVEDFLITVISGVVSEEGKPYISEKLIRSIPDNDGQIDYEKFKKILTRVWYEIYKNTDDVGIILVINPTNGNYTVVDSGQSLTSKSSSVVISGGLDFSDSQGKAGPQVGIA